MNSILEILRFVFPLVVADQIFFYYITNQKHILNYDFNSKVKNSKSVSSLLNVKSSNPAFWLINFEKTYIENNIFTSRNIDKFNIQRKQILIDNYLFNKKWRQRQKQRQIEALINHK